MDVCSSLIERARQDPRRVVFPEPQDERVVEAVSRVVDEGVAKPIIVGKAGQLEAARKKLGKKAGKIEFVDPKASPKLDDYAAAYKRRHLALVDGAIRRILSRPLYFAGQMVAAGDAEGMVAGVANTTGMVISASASTVGYADGISLASSIFLMEMPETWQGESLLVFADAAVAIQPDARELAEIAVTSARTTQALLGIEPRVALLSFSTKKSAVHPECEKVEEATRIAQVMAPDLAIDGELQADAALVESVGKNKAPASSVAGHANVLIFPDLDAGNIGYKLVQWTAGAKAIGPFLQGFAKPMTDMSRGAKVEEIVITAAVTVVRSQKGSR